MIPFDSDFNDDGDGDDEDEIEGGEQKLSTDRSQTRRREDDADSVETADDRRAPPPLALSEEPAVSESPLLFLLLSDFIHKDRRLLSRKGKQRERTSSSREKGVANAIAPPTPSPVEGASDSRGRKRKGSSPPFRKGSKRRTEGSQEQSNPAEEDSPMASKSGSDSDGGIVWPDGFTPSVCHSFFFNRLSAHRKKFSVTDACPRKWSAK
jgi:hypothetical protein